MLPVNAAIAIASSTDYELTMMVIQFEIDDAKLISSDLSIAEPSRAKLSQESLSACLGMESDMEKRMNLIS